RPRRARRSSAGTPSGARTDAPPRAAARSMQTSRVGFGRARLFLVLRHLVIAGLHAAADAVDGRARLLLHALLEVLDLLGMPDRADVADQRVLAELHVGRKPDDADRDGQIHQESDHESTVARSEPCASFQSVARFNIRNATRRFLAHAASL